MLGIPWGEEVWGLSRENNIIIVAECSRNY